MSNCQQLDAQKRCPEVSGTLGSHRHRDGISGLGMDEVT